MNKRIQLPARIREGSGIAFGWPGRDCLKRAIFSTTWQASILLTDKTDVVSYCGRGCHSDKEKPLRKKSGEISEQQIYGLAQPVLAPQIGA